MTDERPTVCLDQDCPLHAHDERGKVQTLETLRELAIRCALKAHGGSVIRAAKALGIGRATLYRFLAKR